MRIRAWEAEILYHVDIIDIVHHGCYPGRLRKEFALELVQVRAAAQRLGVHENTLRRWEESGRIRAVRLPSGVRRFRVEDVELLYDQIHGETAQKFHRQASGAVTRATSASAG
jgi:excisionase family DNA binding protein